MACQLTNKLIIALILSIISIYIITLKLCTFLGVSGLQQQKYEFNNEFPRFSHAKEHKEGKRRSNKQ